VTRFRLDIGMVQDRKMENPTYRNQLRVLNTATLRALKKYEPALFEELKAMIDEVGA